MEQIFIYGASGHGKVVREILCRECRFEIAGFVDDQKLSAGITEFCGLPILGDEGILPDLYRRGIHRAVVAVGDGKSRLHIAERLRKKGFALATPIHPSSLIAGDVRLGEGTVVSAGAIINPGCVVGENVIINSGAVVEHDCNIEDGAHICPGVCLAGGVTVGRLAWVGIGARVIQEVKIGEEAVIGAGSVVLADIPPHVTAAGVPARILRR